MKFKLFILGFVLLLAGACTYQVDPSADVPVISYSQQISPIISANCTQSGCHDNQGELFPLLSYDDVQRIVKPGDAHGSSLYDVIRLYAGERAMPPSPNNPLSDQQIASIYVWILQGAKNN